MTSVQPPCAKDLHNIYHEDWPPYCYLCGEEENCWKESGKLNYMQKYVEGIKKELVLVGRQDEPLAMLYALLSKVKGKDVTAEDVHDAWSIWTTYTRANPDHPSNIPFDDLDKSIQEMDDPYVDGIRKVADGV